MLVRVAREIYLHEILSLSLCYEWLKLWCRKGVDQTSFRNDQQKDLSTGEDGQFVGL